MLCLSRKLDQSVLITVGGLTIRVTVIESTPSRLRLGFEAPEEVRILRTELSPFIEGERDGRTLA
jgi:carbon storage regulator CsrA